MPLELDALLLFALPLLLTFAKFAADTTSRSHQFARSKVTLVPVLRVLLRFRNLPDNVRETVKESRRFSLDCSGLLRFPGLDQSVVRLPDSLI